MKVLSSSAKTGVFIERRFELTICPIPMGSLVPLTIDEILHCLQERWGVSYHLILVKRNKKLYLQVMWGYLEQKSFPLDRETYLSQMNEVLEVINYLGQSEVVRQWISRINGRPRVGQPLTLPLKVDSRLEEFVL